MLHAAAMLTGLAVLWLLYSQTGIAASAATLAFGVAAACVLAALRFGGVGAAFAQAPGRLALGFARAGAVMRGALATMRASIAADITLTPALVRVRTRASNAETRAALADMMSAAPGMVVVECDSDGFLVHVIDEDGVDAADLGRLEARVLGFSGEERAP